jgi:F-type H+-transporting ATPase subunit a
MLTSVVVMLVLGCLAYLGTRRLSLVPSGLQNLLEFAVESLFNLVQSITDDEHKTVKYFSYIATFFLFILVSNYLGLLPGVGTIGLVEGHEFVPLLRSAASDLNMTLALALLSVGLAHYYAIKTKGMGKYLKAWFTLNPILLFVGLIEIVSEFTKIVSLSFRLFGNIFAGETVLEVVSGVMSPYLAPVPFLTLELVVGFVQALVFAILTLTSIIILTADHSEAH